MDLAQNRLRDLDSNPFVNLHSLAALNLERNLLQTLPRTVFVGVNDTLSSLSLLNNLITHFPIEALHYLRELRVCQQFIKFTLNSMLALKYQET